jgi:hypothetical protein
LVRARNAKLRLRLKKPACSYSQVVVLFNRDANQLLQLRILEYFPPFLIAERFR